jgi:hypothetical protein
MPKSNSAFIGGPGSGKSVAAALLNRAFTYAKSGSIDDHLWSTTDNDDPRGREWSFDMDDWNMGMDEKTMQFLRKKLIPPLESGEWPEANQADRIERLQFIFKRPGGIIHGQNLRDKLINPAEINLGIYEVAGEKISKILNIISKADQQGEIVEALKNEEVLDLLLRSDSFIMLINSEVCVDGIEGDIKEKRRIAKLRAESDFDLAILLEAIKNYKHHMGGTIKTFAFMFAKHDKVMYKLNLEKPKEYEDAIKKFLPTMYVDYQFLKNKYTIGDAFYVKSGIKTVDDEEQKKQVPDCPLRFYIHDYLELLKFLVKDK